MAWYQNVVTYDLARQVQTANSFGRFFTGSGRAVTSAFKSFRTVASRLVRDWRVVVVCVQLWPSHSCSCAVGQRTGVAGSQQRWRTLSENGDCLERRFWSLFTMPRRLLTLKALSGVSMMSDVDFAEKRTVEKKKAVLRLLRDVRRARTTAGPQL